MTYRLLGREQVARWAARHQDDRGLVDSVEAWATAKLADHPQEVASFPSLSHAVDALQAFVPDLDVVVTYVVYAEERIVRILAVEDVPS